MHFHTTRFKSLKKYLLTSGMVKNMFWCISWPLESSPFAHTSIPPESKSLKNYFLTSGVVKNVFLCIWAYFHTTRIKSGVVENVFWCISRPPESSPLKSYFLASVVVNKVFWCISWPPESSPSKIIFSRLGWFKTFSHTSRPPESSN